MKQFHGNKARFDVGRESYAVYPESQALDLKEKAHAPDSPRPTKPLSVVISTSRNWSTKIALTFSIRIFDYLGVRTLPFSPHHKAANSFVFLACWGKARSTIPLRTPTPKT